MKELFYLSTVAFLCVIAVSCSKIEPADDDTEHIPFTFGSYDADFSKASTRAVDNTLLSDGSTMAVFGYYTATTPWATTSAATPNLFYNQKVVKTGGAWSYSPLKYWPASGYNHFFAFSPYRVGSVSAPTDTGFPSIVYKVPAEAAAHTDLLWAYNGKRVSTEYPLLNLQKSPGVMNFNFFHALTKIYFSANVGTTLGENRYSITSIALQDLFFEGKSSFKSNPEVDAYTGATWTLTDVDKQQDFIVAIPNGTHDRGLNVVPLTHTPQLITSPNGYLYMMPQLIEGSTYHSPTISVTIYDNVDKVHLVIKTNLTAPGGHTRKAWFAGQAVNYTITYEGGGDTPMALKATVSDWNDQEVPVQMGTYLNVSHNSYTVTTGTIINIFYFTDGTPVRGEYEGSSIDLPRGSGTFSVSAATLGTTYATITAGKLTRKITIIAN